MKIVLPAAGLGTRLLPATKEQPKEMLSIFGRGAGGQLCVKPLLQIVYEQLYDVGFREFCFVVGRGKRTIEDHFTPDRIYVELLQEEGGLELAQELDAFYDRIEDSTIVWVNQPEPRGFGDAVLKAKSFAGNDQVLVHAGDTYITSDGHSHLERLIKAHNESEAAATLVLQEVDDPREYGVAEIGESSVDEVYEVKNAVEKPEEPPTNLAIMPVYIFEPSIFEALEKTPPGRGDEIQLTDGFVKLIDQGKDVRAIKLKSGETRLDIGTGETYWEALKESYDLVKE